MQRAPIPADRIPLWETRGRAIHCTAREIRCKARVRACHCRTTEHEPNRRETSRRAGQSPTDPVDKLLAPRRARAARRPGRDALVARYQQVEAISALPE